MNKVNAAGLLVNGKLNPNWKGGKVEKKCTTCKKEFLVRPGYLSARFCSQKCFAHKNVLVYIKKRIILNKKVPKYLNIVNFAIKNLKYSKVIIKGLNAVLKNAPS